jgi:serine/threonine protein kinase/Tfp pilus assembly protein PilF
MSLAPGSRVGPYEILALIGMGGMGEVYRARDPRLKREIAIKVVGGHHAHGSEQRQRFEREASALAALTHPHICRLYDVGREGDVDFIVMELLDGETLTEYIEHTPAPPISDIVTIAHDIADAVHQAHRAGLVHRDLKPGNVMITTGGVKLLDFGLAKLFDEASAGGTIGPTTSALTGEGKIPGTAQYMAPEQLLGKEVSVRVDIFAMGVILYELLTGRPPFSGGTVVATVAAILSEQPKAIAELRPDVPPSIVKIVERCLQKDPDKRFPTAGALADALSTALTPSTRRRTVVGSPSGRVAKVGGVSPKPRSSGRRRYQRHKVEPRAQDAYQRARFHWQNRTAESLKVSFRYFQAALEADPLFALAHSGLAEWYVTAAMARVVSHGEAMARAKEEATRALELDPMLAEAHGCLGSVFLGDWDLERARHELETALGLDADLADAHVLLARLFGYTKDFTRALEQSALAQQLDPTSPWVHLNAASTYYIARQFERAIEAAERTLQFSPSLANAFYLMGLSRYFLNDPDRGIELLQHAREVAPEHASPVVGLAYVFAQIGRRSDAIALAEELKDRATRAEVSPYDFAELHTGLGDSAAALDYLERSYELHLPELLGIGSDPLFDPIRAEPRFQDLLLKLKLLDS